MPLYIDYNLAYTHLQPVQVHMRCCVAYMNLSHMQKYLKILISGLIIKLLISCAVFMKAAQQSSQVLGY